VQHLLEAACDVRALRLLRTMTDAGIGTPDEYRQWLDLAHARGAITTAQRARLLATPTHPATSPEQLLDHALLDRLAREQLDEAEFAAPGLSQSGIYATPHRLQPVDRLARRVVVTPHASDPNN